MALLIRSDGEEETVSVSTLEDVRRLIGAATAAPVRLIRRRILWCDEDGRPKELPPNNRASELLYAEAARPLVAGEWLLGDVVVTDPGEVKL